jgi:hypothetical protein
MHTQMNESLRICTQTQRETTQVTKFHSAYAVTKHVIINMAKTSLAMPSSGLFLFGAIWSGPCTVGTATKTEHKPLIPRASLLFTAVQVFLSEWRLQIYASP